MKVLSFLKKIGKERQKKRWLLRLILENQTVAEIPAGNVYGSLLTEIAQNHNNKKHWHILPNVWMCWRKTKEINRSYISCTETAQLSILLRVSARLTTTSLWGWGCGASTGANPNLHTCSILPSTSSSDSRTSGASFVLLPSTALKLLSLKWYSR